MSTIRENCNIQILTDTHQEVKTLGPSHQTTLRAAKAKYSANRANFPRYLQNVFCQTCAMEEEDIFKESVITLVLTHH